MNVQGAGARSVSGIGAGALLALAVALAWTAGAANWREVFVASPAAAAGGEGGVVVAFTDGDCYARMTRAREVDQHPGAIVRKHRFENHPAGVRPHTTAPLDYGIAALAALWRTVRPEVGRAGALDRAGAWVSPLLGAGTIAFLWFWAGRERLPARAGALVLLAGSPILAHGFALGRPDHQGLVLACVAVAVAAEFSQWRRPSWGWASAGGAAWGLGLWTSLYEPAVLLGAVLAAGVIWNRPAMWRRERLAGLALGGGILLIALGCEGWRLETPGTGMEPGLFAAWSRQIGELGSVAPWSPVLYRWGGLGLLAAPAALGWAWRGCRGTADGRIALGWLALVTLLFALTCWQLRWGYFLALAGAMSLPWQTLALAGQPRAVRWGLLALWLLGLTPMLGECAGRVQKARRGGEPGEMAERARETLALHGAAEFLRRETALAPSETEDAGGGVLAPWWVSPALAYWSGLPAVAGSSHESLPGTADVARFLLLPARDGAGARAALRARRVRWVVVDNDPERTLPTSADLLGRADAIPPDALGAILARAPERAPRAGLRLAYANSSFKIYAVDPLVYAGPP